MLSGNGDSGSNADSRSSINTYAYSITDAMVD